MSHSGYGESMVMGSPVSSPAAAGAHGTQSPYLPSYLLGEPIPTSPAVQQSTRLFSGQSHSPPKDSSFRKNTSFASPFSHTPGSTVREPNQRRVDVLSGRPKEKPGAPPVTGLLETMTSPLPAQDRWGADHSFTSEQRLGGSPYVSAAHNTPGLSNSVFSPDSSHVYSHSKKNPPSPAQIDPFYTQGESIRPNDELDDTWVTIFGFPPAAASFILQQFSQYGNIQKHVVATDGNWMHVHYQSALQAKKALSKNGKVFGGTIMVGVTPCIDKGVMGCGTGTGMDDTNLGYNTPQRSSYMLNQSSACDRSFLNTSQAAHNTSIRPLTAAYKAANSEHEVAPGNRTPQKNSGIISKTMEMMFGW